MIKLLVFLAGSLALVLVSLPCLRQPRSRGFYRFLAFESLLALILLNLESWFRNPLSVRQIVSWVVLFWALGFATAGFYALRMTGKPRGSLENTTALVTSGIYRYIRHPLYSSLGLLGWGVFVKEPSPLGLVLAHAVMFSVFATARAEETENLKKFGPSYESYLKTTKRFIPFVY